MSLGTVSDGEELLMWFLSDCAKSIGWLALFDRFTAPQEYRWTEHPQRRSEGGEIEAKGVIHTRWSIVERVLHCYIRSCSLMVPYTPFLPP